MARPSEVYAIQGIPYTRRALGGLAVRALLAYRGLHHRIEGAALVIDGGCTAQ